ncbi:unnamed protein product [Adineta ricciae]|nr:unnamed protein product [Adineta ricciae]
MPAIVTSNSNLSGNQQVIDDSTRTNDTTMTNSSSTVAAKKDSTRKESPVRVTITSQLNPNAIPFYAQHPKLPALQNPSFTFYERPRFRPRLPTVVSPDRAQTVPYGRNVATNNNQQRRPPQHQQQPNSYQRFVPLRQMAIKKNVTQNSSPRTNTRSTRAPPPPIAKYRFHPTNSPNKQAYPQQQQQQQQQKPPNNIHGPELMRQTSLPPENQLLLIPAGQSNLFQQRKNPIHQSNTSIHSTTSLPYHYGSSVDHNQRLTPVSVGEPIGSRRYQRTCSMASSCSSVSVDIGPHSIVQFDSSSPKVLPSFDEQYDFEKANEEFRRYLELEELVTRRSSSHCSMGSSTDINASQQQAQAHSYKKDISFFDHISCTATTGTAVGYTEMDETEKNLETFGDDALLLASKSTDNEWEI